MNKLSPAPSRKIIKFFKSRGFVQMRQSRGGHVTLHKDGVKRPVVVCHPRKDLPVEHIKNNLKTAGETRAELNRFLGRE